MINMFLNKTTKINNKYFYQFFNSRDTYSPNYVVGIFVPSPSIHLNGTVVPEMASNYVITEKPLEQFAKFIGQRNCKVFFRLPAASFNTSISNAHQYITFDTEATCTNCRQPSTKQQLLMGELEQKNSPGCQLLCNECVLENYIDVLL